VPHHTPLIATIAIGLGLAFLLGLMAHRFRLPPIAGYLAAGIVIGPFTPGYVADQELAKELAEIGVILLMFGVGLHFSLKSLLSVRGLAIPGAIVQVAVATLLGIGLALMLDWSLGAGLVFGLALSVASTVVLLRALQERGIVETERGRIAVGWLIVEDLVMVLALVMIPPLAGMLGGQQLYVPRSSQFTEWLPLGPIATTLLVTAVKVGLFMALMLVVGRRAIPAILHYVAHTGSRELFRLSVFAIALGFAYGSAFLFGVSFALGAFFAGMILAESQLSTQAARETLPLRDAFAVLFFVSVGMLFNPAVIVANPLAVAGTFAIIVVGKFVAAYGIVRLFGYGRSVALTISASLAQIGEFSFILAVLGVKLAIIPEMAKDLIIAGAILSILVNPVLFAFVDSRTEYPNETVDTAAPAGGHPATGTTGSRARPEPAVEVVVVGYGLVGKPLVDMLVAARKVVTVVDDDETSQDQLAETGVTVLKGAAGEKATFARMPLARANWLVVTIPDAFEAGHIVEAARATNPALRILARARHEEEADYLRTLGADVVVSSDKEVARGMLRTILSPR